MRDTIELYTQASVDDGGQKGTLIECPICHQKLLSIVETEGYVRLRCQCRRCHRYIRVEIIE